MRRRINGSPATQPENAQAMEQASSSGLKWLVDPTEDRDGNCLFCHCMDSSLGLATVLLLIAAPLLMYDSMVNGGGGGIGGGGGGASSEIIGGSVAQMKVQSLIPDSIPSCAKGYYAAAANGGDASRTIYSCQKCPKGRTTRRSDRPALAAANCIEEDFEAHGDGQREYHDGGGSSSSSGASRSGGGGHR